MVHAALAATAQATLTTTARESRSFTLHTPRAARPHREEDGVHHDRDHRRAHEIARETGELQADDRVHRAGIERGPATAGHPGVELPQAHQRPAAHPRRGEAREHPHRQRAGPLGPGVP